MARKASLMVYRNEKYGFSLVFPSRWKSYAVIKTGSIGKETEYEVHFRFKYKGKIFGDIFALLVFRLTHKEWADQGYEDSPLGFLAESKGRIFAYITPGELPHSFIDPKTGDYNYKKYGNPIRLLKRMVNKEYPV